MTKKNYEELAIQYVEKYGIIEYELKGSILRYSEKSYDGQRWNTYHHQVQLNVK